MSCSNECAPQGHHVVVHWCSQRERSRMMMRGLDWLNGISIQRWARVNPKRNTKTRIFFLNIYSRPVRNDGFFHLVESAGIGNIVIVVGGVDFVGLLWFIESRCAPSSSIHPISRPMCSYVGCCQKVAKRRTQINMSFLHDNTSDACSSCTESW